MRSIALATALLAATLMPAIAQEIPGTRYSFGFWEGAAQSDSSGAFSHCSVSVGYANGETLWIGLYGNDTLSVLLAHPDVRFQTGQTFDSWLMLEVGLPTRGTSEAWDEAFAGMTLEGIDASIDFLTQGQYLRLLGIGIDDSYDVNGITEALALARECVARQTGGNPGVAPVPKVSDILKPKTGSAGGIGADGALGTPAPKPAP
ncbi:MAG: hypothetical protein C0524_09705 [Rhodobacter sp.]|nr:hypothetical protein [Rhodobacter sp.]